MRKTNSKVFQNTVLVLGATFFTLAIFKCDAPESEADIDLSNESGQQQISTLTRAASVNRNKPTAAEWPQWRGPNRDGISLEKGWRKKWLDNPPKVLWRKPFGEGFSGISIANEKAYTMFSEGSDEYAVCLDAVSGNELWRVKTGKVFSDWQGGDGPRSTPLIDSDLAYFLSGHGKLFALNAETGAEIWASDFQKEFGASPPEWGFSGSPLIEGDALFIETGGNPGSALVAFDKNNGNVLWTSQTDKAGYSSPISAIVGDIHQIIFFTGTQIFSVSPSNGTLFWMENWKTPYDVNAATPIFISPDKLFISSGYDVGSALFQMNRVNDEISVDEVWRSRELKNRMSTPIYYQEHIYGFDTKFLRCVDARNGETVWSGRGFGEGTLILSDGHLITLSEKGKLALIEASPESFNQIASVKLLKGKCWTVPTLANGKIFARNESEIVCLDVSNN